MTHAAEVYSGQSNNGHLRIVRDTERMDRLRTSTVEPAIDDDLGQVVVPRIDRSTGLMPNGQSVESFYTNGDMSREKFGGESPVILARRALRNAGVHSLY